MEFILGQAVYLDADPQSDCAILLLFSYPGDHMEARRLILKGAPLFPRSRRRSASRRSCLR
jgi:hypothetical protein